VQPTLVELAIEGGEDAFASLMVVAGDRLLAIAYRILRDLGRAEDAVQNAFVSAWRDLPSLRDPLLFEARPPPIR
jgi:RNA polymerase sigma-70 factor (ECF subfamily)